MESKHNQDQNTNSILSDAYTASIQENKKEKKKKRIWIASISAFLLLILAAALTWYLVDKHNKEVAAEQERAFNQLVDDTIGVTTFYEGISIEGIDVGGKTINEAEALLKELEPSLRDEVDLTITYKNNTYTLTEDDFSYEYNTQSVLLNAYGLYRTGDRMERYENICALRDSSPKEYEITVKRTDTETVVKNLVDRIDTECSVAAVPGKISFHPLSDNRFSYTDGSNGLVIDVESLTNQITEILNSDDQTGSLEAPTKVVEYAGLSDDLATLTQLISTYSTTSTNTANGTANMRRALELVNGTVLQPGEVFSFNGIVGDTTAERGFYPAGVIVNGQSTTGYGGGVCQASTTIYGAVLRADLTVVARSPHSIRSSYVPIGQDAAIAYPSLDFQFKNNYDTPIYIEAWESGNKLTVNIYGKHPEAWDTIEVVSRQTSTIPQPEDILTVDNSLAPGQKIKEQSGRSGSTATGEKFLYKNGQVIKTESISNYKYPAKAAKYRVGPSE